MTTPEVATRTTSLRELVAEEIRSTMGAKRISGAQLARRLGVSQTYIWRRTIGETPFDLDDVERVAAVLRVDPLELLRRAARRFDEVRPNHRSASVAERLIPTPRTTPFRAPARPKGRGRRDSTRPSTPVRPGQRRPVPVPPPTVQPIHA